MKAALIAMTILGCDDSVTQCHYIDTVGSTWETVALCDAQSEAQIGRYHNSNYPVIVAVCDSERAQNADAQDDLSLSPAGQNDVPAAAPAAEAPAPPASVQPGLTARTLAMLRHNLPDTAAVKETMVKPFRYAEDGYSWVVRKFAD